jgi:hypothetical protein
LEAQRPHDGAIDAKASFRGILHLMRSATRQGTQVPGPAFHLPGIVAVIVY